MAGRDPRAAVTSGKPGQWFSEAGLSQKNRAMKENGASIFFATSLNRHPWTADSCMCSSKRRVRVAGFWNKLVGQVCALVFIHRIDSFTLLKPAMRQAQGQALPVASQCAHRWLS